MANDGSRDNNNRCVNLRMNFRALTNNKNIISKYFAFELSGDAHGPLKGKSAFELGSLIQNRIYRTAFWLWRLWNRSQMEAVGHFKILFLYFFNNAGQVFI